MTATPWLPFASSSQRKMLLLALVLALLWAQALGLAHRVLHPSFAAVQSQSEDGAQLERRAHLQGLMSHFEGAPGVYAADCRLLDQLGLEQPVPPVLPVIAALFEPGSNNVFSSYAFEQIFRALYASRAPPSVL